MLQQPQQHSREVKVVGIVGFGGDRKTLGKQIFNCRRSDYSQSWFLFYVIEATAKSSLTSLQSKLYKDFAVVGRLMYSVDEGITMLRCRLSCFQTLQTLIIVDDAANGEQLRVIFNSGGHLSFTVHHSSSLILVTFCNKDVFTITV